MFKNARFTSRIWLVGILVLACSALGQSSAAPGAAAPSDLARYKQEYSAARIEPARMDHQAGIAVIFTGTHDLHYYASPKTAPAPGFELKVQAKSDAFDFGKAIFPKWHIITDSAGTKVEVYAGDFTVFVPITAAKAPAQTGPADIEVKIAGITCTSLLCLPPFEKTLQTKIDWRRRDSWNQISFETQGGPETWMQSTAGPSYSTWFALMLAFVAGVILNIMPCVLPVIPLKVLSIFEQARESKAKCIALGLSFCFGIVLFFVALAVLNIVLRLGYGTAFQWGDHFRNPAFLVGMALLMVVLAMFMFGVFTISPPASIAGKAGPRKGLAGSAAMGFLAAILSTPCSFAILTAAFAWAQTQKLPLATVAILLIGVGMAAPYAILTSIPSLLKYLPRAGRWSELFKQAMGFVLLLVAVWLMAALPKARSDAVLYFGVILALCVWMWGGWVTFSTPAARKWVIRTIAVALAVASGVWLLPANKTHAIDWQPYDAARIDGAIKQQQPVLIEFTAAWCLTCKAVEKTVYARRDIAGLIKDKDVLAIKGDTTLRQNPASVDLQEIYKEPGVPVTILFVPGKAEPVRLHGLLIGADLKTLLEKLPDKKSKATI
jgi:thiol:disulfide interchange protein